MRQFYEVRAGASYVVPATRTPLRPVMSSLEISCFFRYLFARSIRSDRVGGEDTTGFSLLLFLFLVLLLRLLVRTRQIEWRMAFYTRSRKEQRSSRWLVRESAAETDFNAQPVEKERSLADVDRIIPTKRIFTGYNSSRSFHPPSAGDSRISFSALPVKRRVSN